jgi:hypothetical protein
MVEIYAPSDARFRLESDDICKEKVAPAGVNFFGQSEERWQNWY